jgi:hypothetical protein
MEAVKQGSPFHIALCLHPSFKHTSGYQDAVLAFEANDADIRSYPDYFPFITTARVGLLKLYHIAQPDVHYHVIKS